MGRRQGTKRRVRAYRRPELKRRGRLAKVTRGDTIVVTDGGGGGGAGSF